MLKNHYKDRDLIYKLATYDESKKIEQILADNPMGSWVNITLRREPDYFRSERIFGESRSVIAYKESDEEDEIVGIYSCSLMRVFYKGEKESIIYLSLLRLDKKHRNKIRYLKSGFDSIVKIIDFKPTLPFMFTSIASENLKAKRVLESDIKGMPSYIPLKKLTTLIFKTKDYNIKRSFKSATNDDIEELANFYNLVAKSYDLAPILDLDWLKSLDGNNGLKVEDFYIQRDEKEEIIAIFAIWDQRELKQIVIEGYKESIKIFRPIYNLFANLLGYPTLPKKGEMVEGVYISFFVTLKDDERLRMLKEASSIIKSRGIDLAMIGFEKENPFSNIVKNEFKCHEYVTDIEAVFLSGKEVEDVKIDKLGVEIAIL